MMSQQDKLTQELKEHPEPKIDELVQKQLSELELMKQKNEAANAEI